jgi:hypothetical protein
MLFGQVKYLIYEALTGGKPSVDTALWESDIDLQIIVGCNKILYDLYKQDWFGDDGSRFIQQQLILSTPPPGVSLSYDTLRRQYYTALPWKIISLTKGRGLVYVGTFGGKSFIPGQQGEDAIEKYIEKYKQTETTYYLEGGNIYLRGLANSGNARILLMKAYVAPTDLNDADTLPIPEEKVADLIAYVTAYFAPVRTTPRDNQEDNEDITTTNKSRV